MRITSVGYSKLQNLGNYENEKIDAHADVAEGGDPEGVLATLQTWVKSQLAGAQGMVNYEEAVAEAQGRAQMWERRLAEAQKRWEAYLAFTARLGLQVPKDLTEDLPF